MATDPSSSSSSTASAIPLIDVELESIKSDQNRNLLQEHCLFIPEDYYARMAGTGLLDQLVTLVKDQAEKNREMKQQLDKYHICIPSCFYPAMTKTGLIELIDSVQREQQMARSKRMDIIRKRTYQYTHDDDDDNDIVEIKWKRPKPTTFGDQSISTSIEQNEDEHS